MAETNNDKLFRTKVLPIMNKVMRDLRLKQSEEMAIHTSSLPYIMAGAAGPDGGMSAQAASLASLRYTGKWNSKHTEDYVQMVKDELKKQHIAVTPEIEKMMIEKMIKDEIPKSSIDYIMRKAATNTIFYLPQALNKSPLENHITAQAEKRYNPSTLEKGTGYVLGAAADYMTMGGIGGSWSGAAKFVGVDLALNAAIDKVGAKETDDVPLIIAPEHRAEYKATQAKRNQEQPKPKPKENTPTVERTTETQVQPVKEQKEVAQTQPEAQQEQPQQTNQNGWSGLLSSVGLNGISDIGHNLGYVLAMLPDMLVGIFTGKTKSLGLKDNMLPLASIVAGMFVRNPILKMVLIGMGGLNLLNKAGHEALDNHKGVSYGQGGNANVRGNYKVYEDEALNARISQPQIKGNCLIATIDKVPCTIALPDRVVDAYNQGALPLNTLANAVLAKNDQMRQIAAENYAASEQQAQTRPLAQR
ncbi:MAG: hypothetical protein UDK36_03060 [Bacteroidaceae bacterium]|nr:hypothetical protein [Bacteroidaceae bacterium]